MPCRSVGMSSGFSVASSGEAAWARPGGCGCGAITGLFRLRSSSWYGVRGPWPAPCPAPAGDTGIRGPSRRSGRSCRSEGVGVGGKEGLRG